MKFCLNVTPVLIAVFFFIVLSSPSHAQTPNVCSLESIAENCGEGAFACVSPIPTPATENPWIKVKSSSFSANSNASLNTFSVPVNVGLRQPFNPTDPDENIDGDVEIESAGYFLFGDTTTNAPVKSGVLSAPQVGSGLAGGEAQSGWVVDGYTRNKEFSPAKFADYASARKRVNKITSLGEMQKERVNIITVNDGETASITDYCASGDRWDAAEFIKTQATERGPYVLIVEGDLTINRDINFKKSGVDVSGCVTGLNALDTYGDTASTISSVPLTLVVTGTLTIESSSSTAQNHVNQINALVMAQNVVIKPVATTDSTGLKIKGNLIVQDNLDNSRVRDDSRRPVLFIVQDPGMYMDLLPYFSTAEYEWREIK